MVSSLRVMFPMTVLPTETTMLGPEPPAIHAAADAHWRLGPGYWVPLLLVPLLIGALGALPLF